MTLIESMMVDCVRLVLSSASDDLLGHHNDWTDGDHFRAAIIKQTNQASAAYQLTEAEQPDLSEQYTVVVPTGTVLGFHEAFRRVSDGATFLVTGDVRDTQAPIQSTVPIAKTTAERWDPE